MHFKACTSRVRIRNDHNTTTTIPAVKIIRSGSVTLPPSTATTASVRGSRLSGGGRWTARRTTTTSTTSSKTTKTILSSKPTSTTTPTISSAIVEGSSSTLCTYRRGPGSSTSTSCKCTVSCCAVKSLRTNTKSRDGIITPSSTTSTSSRPRV